jgi:hypothetical protein
MMTWFDHSRRAASVLLVVLCLLTIPAFASATFTGTASSEVQVGTLRLETPSRITGNYDCKVNPNKKTITVRVTDFTVNDRLGLTYNFRLAPGPVDGVVPVSSTTKSQVLDVSTKDDGASTTWTLGIQSVLNTWTSAIGTVDLPCPRGGGTGIPFPT